MIYQFDKMELPNGEYGYKRRDGDLWITYRDKLGWVAYDEESQTVMGRPWNILPDNQNNAYPPEDEWVSKKHEKSYIYKLMYKEAKK